MHEQACRGDTTSAVQTSFGSACLGGSIPCSFLSHGEIPILCTYSRCTCSCIVSLDISLKMRRMSMADLKPGRETARKFIIQIQVQRHNWAGT